MILSSLSLLTTGLTMISQRKIARGRDYVSIEFDVTGASLIAKKKSCKLRVKGIRNGISSLLGIDESLLEVTKPMTIKKGLRVTTNIYINNTKAIDMSIEKDMNEAQQSGELAEIIKEAWDLSAIPNVSEVKYIIHESKERKKNRVELTATTSEKEGEARNNLKAPTMNQNGIQLVNSISNSYNDSQRETAISMEMPPQIPAVEVDGIQTPGINTNKMNQTAGGDISMDDSDSSEKDQYETKQGPEPIPPPVPPVPKHNGNKSEDSLDKLQHKFLSDEINDEEDIMSKGGTKGSYMNITKSGFEEEEDDGFVPPPPAPPGSLGDGRM